MIESVYIEPDEAYINAEMSRLEEIVEAFCGKFDFDIPRIKVNPKSLVDVIKRVHKRKEYYKFFHKGMEINEYKVMGLYGFWILKLKPFWVEITVNDSEENADTGTRINEKIVLYLFMTFIKRVNYKFYYMSEDLIQEYLDELLYSFRYRDISKEAMFLMLEPGYFMFHFQESFDENGVQML